MLLAAGYMLLIGQGMLFAAASVSVMIHECSHALCAKAVGYAPQEIELTPIGAVMYLNDEAAMPIVKRMLVILAGPAATLMLTAAAYHAGMLHMAPMEVCRVFFLSNLSILILNLLPVLPLDGGKMALQLLRGVLPRNTAAKVMKWAGYSVGAAMVILNVWVCWRYGGLNLSLALCGCFLIYGASSGTMNAFMNEIAMLIDRNERFDRRGIEQSQVLTVRPDTLLRCVVGQLPRKNRAILALQDERMKISGICTEQALLKCYFEHPGGECSLLAQHIVQIMSLS